MKEIKNAQHLSSKGFPAFKRDPKANNKLKAIYMHTHTEIQIDMDITRKDRHKGRIVNY